MENLDKEISSNKKQTFLRSFTFRRIDLFGTMLGFQIKGIYNYQTTLGASFSLIFFASLTMVMVYYTHIYNARKPNITTSSYVSCYEKMPPVDLIKEGLIFNIRIINLKSAETSMPTDIFLQNFSLKASVLHNPKGKPFQWKNYPVIPCKDYNLKKKNIHNYDPEGFCIQTDQLELNGAESQSNQLHISMHDCVDS